MLDMATTLIFNFHYHHYKQNTHHYFFLRWYIVLNALLYMFLNSIFFIMRHMHRCQYRSLRMLELLELRWICELRKTMRTTKTTRPTRHKLTRNRSDRECGRV